MSYVDKMNEYLAQKKAYEQAVHDEIDELIRQVNALLPRIREVLEVQQLCRANNIRISFGKNYKCFYIQQTPNPVTRVVEPALCYGYCDKNTTVCVNKDGCYLAENDRSKLDRQAVIANLKHLLNNYDKAEQEFYRTIDAMIDHSPWKKKERMQARNTEELAESFLCTPCGEKPGNYILFYAGSCYEYNTPEIILEYGKQFGMGHIYLAGEGSAYKGVYNGDTYVLYKDIDMLPDDMKYDAECYTMRESGEDYEI